MCCFRVTKGIKEAANWLRLRTSFANCQKSLQLFLFSITGASLVLCGDSANLQASELPAARLLTSDVSLAWDAPTRNSDGTPLLDLKDYRLKLGTAPGGPYPQSYQTTTPSFRLSNLPQGVYYVVVSAVDRNGNESSPSNELLLAVGLSNVDSDNDGLSDEDEYYRRTNPYKKDTDLDGVRDGQEVTDVTNPLDRGSYSPLHPETVCAPWNGFLFDRFGRGMWNIFENLNVGSTTLDITTRVYNINGEERDSLQFSLAPGLQRDLLIHDSSARLRNSYGNTCSSVASLVGDLRATMVYYKTASNGQQLFDFAMASPAIPGKPGSQYVLLNTFQPSLAAKDANNGLANWAQITNENSSAQSGKIRFWRSDGTLVSETEVSIQSKARYDVALHSVGKNVVGFAEWIPNDAEALFKIDSARYFYDNPEYVNSFETAFLLPSSMPSGEVLAAPFDTRETTAVLEIANVLDGPVTALVRLRTASGELREERTIALPGRNTTHLILDGIAPNELGFALIQGSQLNSIVATAMHYRRRADNSVSYLYGVPAVPPIGLELVGSYNTFIGHANQLYVANVSASEQVPNIFVTRSSGEKLLNGVAATIKPWSLHQLDVNSLDTANNYGVIRVQTPSKHALAAWVLRRRVSDYAIPTQLTE